MLIGLLGVAVGVVGLLPAACTSGPGSGGRSPTGTPVRTPSPDEQAAGRGALAALALLDREALLAQARPALRPLLGVLAGQHRTHLVALGVHAPELARTPTQTPPATPTQAHSGTPGPSGPPSPTGPVPADLVRAEREAAVQALADVRITSAGAAGLLARIAAARVVHADLLAAAVGLPVPDEPRPAHDTPSASPTSASPTSASPTSSPTSSPTGMASPTPDATTVTVLPLDPTAVIALSALLSAEHAAVFGYGLLTARVLDARRPAVRTLWMAHRARRDELERRLADAGVTPPAALPAYDVGPAPNSPAALATLGARIEDAMATAALSAVYTSTGEVRSQVALDLVRAARRATGWRGTPTALPG
jgi:hypothetical protein